ncbi:MAG: adenylate/guanylate cyclase domain-containing protein [Deltaproteobacteria bacterium]|nr:adenylate/guanylate cyclase domain-containing protein [Deltaproteobacteria bacterium]
MRLSLTLKLGLLSALLILLVAGSTTYVLVFRFGQIRERELVGRDRELARVLAGLRNSRGDVNFKALTTFVASADSVDTGLVYALKLDDDHALRLGALNPKLFARLDPTYRIALKRGNQQVLNDLVRGKIERQGRIKEYALPIPGGVLRLGFDLRRIDRLIAQQTTASLIILGIGLLLGTLASIFLARSFGGKIKRLARAMEAVASGDLNQTVQVKSHDELASLAGSFNLMTRALRATEANKRLARLYLSEKVAERLSRENDPLTLSAEERAVTVGIFEIVGFDEHLAHRSPRESLQLLNEYLAPLLDALHAHGAVVLRLAPAHIQALWGALEGQPDAEIQAVRAAITARDAIDREARGQQIAGLPGLRLRAGVASGQVALGNIGSIDRLAYAAIGQPVDLAARIAAEAQPGDVFIAEQTFRHLPAKEFQATPQLPLPLRDGKELPLYRL